MNNKELREKIEGLRKKFNKRYLYRSEIIEPLFEIAYEYDLEYIVENIISAKDIDDFIQARLESSGWQGVTRCLEKVKYVDDNYYLINRYGNLEEITLDYLRYLVDDLSKEVEY